MRLVVSHLSATNNSQADLVEFGFRPSYFASLVFAVPVQGFQPFQPSSLASQQAVQVYLAAGQAVLGCLVFLQAVPVCLVWKQAVLECLVWERAAMVCLDAKWVWCSSLVLSQGHLDCLV